MLVTVTLGNSGKFPHPNYLRCTSKFRKQKEVINHIELVHDSQTENCMCCKEKIKKTEKLSNQESKKRHKGYCCSRKEEEVENFREGRNKADMDVVEETLDLGVFDLNRQTCTICGKRFINKNKLMEHQRETHWLKCTECIEKFPFQQKRDEQLKKHCEVCDNLFQNKAKMIQHKQTHMVRFENVKTSSIRQRLFLIIYRKYL